MGMNRRGEMTTQQIVTMIILLASFVVILFFLSRLAIGEDTDTQVCHNSVIVRGSGVSALMSATPLDCKKVDVCISKDGSCETMHKPKVIEVDDKLETYKVLADELANCWWMFGEGKVNYVGSDYFENLYCSLCSQIAFDDSMTEIFESNLIDKGEFMYYMTLANYSEDETYSEYMYKTNDLKEIWNGEYGTIDTTKQHYAMMAITSDISTLGWTLTGAAAAGAVTAGLLMSPITGGLSLSFIPVAIGAVAGGTIGAAIPQTFLAKTVEGESGNDFILPTIVEANSAEYNALKCEDIVTKS